MQNSNAVITDNEDESTTTESDTETGTKNDAVESMLKNSAPFFVDEKVLAYHRRMIYEAKSTGSRGAKLLVPNSKSGATSAKWSLAPEMPWHQKCHGTTRNAMAPEMPWHQNCHGTRIQSEWFKTYKKRPHSAIPTSLPPQPIGEATKASNLL
ncbi:hypothetical protein Tco_0868762 [Tanacetum coccineum]